MSSDELPKHINRAMTSTPDSSSMSLSSNINSSTPSFLDPVVFFRRFATLCFCTGTCFQAFSLLGEAEISRSSPSSLYAAYAPHPYAQLGFFVVGVMTQLLWLLGLYPVVVAGHECERIGLGSRRTWSGCACRSMRLLRRAPRREGSDGEDPALLFLADEDAQNNTRRGQSGKDDANIAPDSRPGTPEDEREARKGQVLPMRPQSSSKPASWPKSGAIPVIEVTGASGDDVMSEMSERGDSAVDSQHEQDASSSKVVMMSESLQMCYMPLYFVSTSCQVGWTCAWIMRHYNLCIVLVFLNLFSQIYALFVTLDGSRNHRFPTSNILTQFTAKLRIAMAILCLWKTWGAVDVVPPPTLFEGVMNCTFFILLSGASGPDPTMGMLLALILLSLGMGRHNNLEWHLMFNWSSVVVFLFVALDWAAGVQVRQILWLRTSNSDSEDDC